MLDLKPTPSDTDIVHIHKSPSFKLHRLPIPCPGAVLGLVGRNGLGKSTALKILGGLLKPNLGDLNVSI